MTTAARRRRNRQACRQYRKTHPWTRHVEWAQRRCKDEEHSHYEKGVRCLITYAEAGLLWVLYRACEMKTPSLDRIESSKDYTFENCRFIEKHINERLPHDEDLRREYEELPEECPF